LTFIFTINLSVCASVIIIMWWIVVAVVVVVLGYYWQVARLNKYWLEKGVNQGRYMTIFGDSWKIFARKQCFAEMVQEVYNKFPNSRQE
jgi:hypothetical protein